MGEQLNNVPREPWATGGTFKEISKSKFYELQIPLPPLEVQKEIVAEIEGYQKVIAANRELIARLEKRSRPSSPASRAKTSQPQSKQPTIYQHF